MKSDVLIAGGGMGGICAAIILSGAGKKVTILERQERIGRKLMLTGSGKCNISNADMSAAHFLSDMPEKTGKLIDAFGKDKAEEFLAELGIRLCEKNGFLYPVTRQASSVMDALRFKLEENGADIVTDAFINKLEKKDKHFILHCEDGRSFTADKCILACGGSAGIYDEENRNGYALAAAIGHRVYRPAPALVQLVCEEELKAIAGIRCDVGISLVEAGRTLAKQKGELQISAGMFSGIPVFQLSRYIKNFKNTELIIDFLPYMTDETEIRKRYRNLCSRELEKFFAGILNKNLAIFLIKREGLKPSLKTSELDENEVLELIRAFKNQSFKLKNTNGFKNAQVSSGGIPLSEVSDRLESRIIPGLYIIGEMLNVCGECGGYNLHFAMASAHAAAEGLLCTE
ncbi:MAG: aminoacetone oxidase family FAD-binding enzyme [Lachnospiraceae bacterium]|nr:aminoacetone oxidase family FAD-binding enzyme [Lachnospiraceae bacterium]